MTSLIALGQRREVVAMVVKNQAKEVQSPVETNTSYFSRFFAWIASFFSKEKAVGKVQITIITDNQGNELFRLHDTSDVENAFKRDVRAYYKLPPEESSANQAKPTQSALSQNASASQAPKQSEQPPYRLIYHAGQYKYVSAQKCDRTIHNGHYEYDEKNDYYRYIKD